MGLIVVNNTWTLDETIGSSTYNTTLKTAGTFLDKNIDIILTPKVGSVELSDNSSINQSITVTNDNYAVKATANVTVTPTVINGWVDSVSTKEVQVENTIYLDKTQLESGLIEDSSEPSGSSVYRVSATKGYNDNKLSKDIDVFQGEIIF